MKTHRLTQLASTLLIAATVTACTETDNDNAPAPATAATATTAIAPAPKGAEVNGPIKPSDIDLAFSVMGAPAYDAATDTLNYTVNLTNNGKTTVASAGSHPVNIGVVILGADGTLRTPPAKQDFVRIHLPQSLEPGQKIDLPVKFRVAPTIGGTVIVDAVQERVAWFRSYNKPVLTLGNFARCNGDEKSACLSDGTAIASAQ